MSWIIEKRKRGTEIFVTNLTTLEQNDKGQPIVYSNDIFVGEGYDKKEYKRSMELAEAIAKALNKHEAKEITKKFHHLGNKK